MSDSLRGGDEESTDRATEGPLAVALAAALQGDAHAVLGLLGHPQEDLARAADVHSVPLLLCPAAVRGVLEGLTVGTVAPADAQRWAAFVRYGYLPQTHGSPVEPLPIEYDAEAEERMVVAIARLEQLGDTIDGVLEEQEITTLLRHLDAL